MTKDKGKVKLRVSILKYTNLCLGIILLFSVGDFRRQTNSIKDTRKTVLTVSAEQAAGYQTYSNQRFGYSIDYPSDFTRADGSNDSNGAKFYSSDRNAILTVYGLNNMHRENPEFLYRTDLSVIKGTTTYSSLKGNSYEIRWIDNTATYYRRVEAGLGCINVVMFQCPVNQATKYNTLVDHINASFKTGKLDETY